MKMKMNFSFFFARTRVAQLGNSVLRIVFGAAVHGTSVLCFACFNPSNTSWMASLLLIDIQHLVVIYYHPAIHVSMVLGASFIYPPEYKNPCSFLTFT